MTRILLLTMLAWVAIGSGWLCGQTPTDDLGTLSFAEPPPAPADLTPDSPSVEALPSEWLDELNALRQRVHTLEATPRSGVAAPPAAKSAELKTSVNWTGQVQSDFYWFNQSTESREAFGDIENGSAFRRARLGMFGEYGAALYRIEVDFALSGRPSFLDMYTGVEDVPGLGRVRVGHFFEPLSLERVTPNRFVTFMERSLADQPFAPARNLGIMANNTACDERVTWALGVFRANSDVFGDDVGDNFEDAVTGRITGLPIDEDKGRELLHLGAAYSFRGADNERVRFRAQPEARLGSANPNVPFLVDTGEIPADTFQLIGLELAWVNGPFSMQSEYMLAPVDAQLESTLYFQGWMTQFSYFLTGEHRPYNRELGIFSRLIPNREFVRVDESDPCQPGYGAWEVALRVSHLDLNDGSIQGGQITDVTVGLNWYVNRYLRVTANYVHAFADDPTVGATDTDIFATRVGFEF